MTTKQILGVKFFSGSAIEAVESGLLGGLVVVPSAPVLVGIEKDLALRAGVLGADLAITDSGLMVLMWWLLKREKLERVSGLEYLKLLLEELRRPETARRLAADVGANLKPEDSNLNSDSKSQFLDVNSPSSTQVEDFRSQVSHAGSGVFWVMPTEAARDRNLAWLRSQGFATTEADCYVAPHYGAGELHDERLLALVRQRHPKHIIIALGGGVQERLGWFLKQQLEKPPCPATPLFPAGNPEYVLDPASYSAVPGIHCIGAAIGFLSGEQVRIPMWVDYLYLGWLWRSVSAPTKFVPRYWKATRLVWLMIRYGAEAP